MNRSVPPFGRRRTLRLLAALPLLLSLQATGTEATGEGPSLAAFDELPAGGRPLRAGLERLAVGEASGGYVERRTLPGFPKPMVTRGVFRLQGETLTWEAVEPFPSVMRISPEGIVIEADGDRQTLSRTEVPAAGRAAELLCALLSGRLEALEALLDVRAERRGERLFLAARPRPADAGIARVVRELRAGATLGTPARVDALELLAADGTLTRIDLGHASR